MAIWNFLKDGVPIGDSFDDGQTLLPGEDGFSKEAAIEQAATIGNGVIPDYAGNPSTYGSVSNVVGTPNND